MPPPWHLTPGEFEDLVEGAAEGVKQDAFNMAMIVSAVLSTAGVKVPPQAIIDPDYEYGDAPLAKTQDEVALEAHQRYQDEVKRKGEREHREWLAAMGFEPEG